MEVRLDLCLLVRWWIMDGWNGMPLVWFGRAFFFLFAGGVGEGSVCCDMVRSLVLQGRWEGGI